MAKQKRRRDKGTGSIFQLSDGRWRSEVIWVLPDGRNKTTTFTRKRKEDVVREHNRRLGEIGAGTYRRTPDTGTMDALMRDWLEKEIFHRLRIDTYRSYKYLYESHVRPKLGKMKLNDITRRHVRELLDEKRKSGLSANTVQRIQGTIRSAFNRAIGDGEVDQNPATGIKVKKGNKKEIKFLQPVQAKALLDACRDSSVAPPLLMAIGTGMRLGEVLGLRWKDIDFEQSVVRLHVQLKRSQEGFYHAPLKTDSSRRTLPITTTVAESLNLAERLKGEANDEASKLDLVFLSPTGGPVHQKWFNVQLKDLCATIGITEVSAHSLRHTAASLLIAAGIDIAMVQQQLGHSTITLTADTYGHMIPAGMRRAGNALDKTLRAGKVG